MFALYQATLLSRFAVCFAAVMCASVVAVDTLQNPTSIPGVKYLSLSAHTEEHDVKDECEGAAECTCTCFCRGKCLSSQSIPSELSLIHRSKQGPAKLAGDENLENDAASIFLLLRDIALPLLCRDEPLWRPCLKENRLANTTTFQQVHLQFGGKWGPYARCMNGFCELPECAVCHLNQCETACPAKDVIPGRQLLSQRYTRPLGTRCKLTKTRFADCERPWEVWAYMLSNQLQEGLLVHLPAAGKCQSTPDDNAMPDASSQCSWQLISTGKKVTADCIKARLVELIENRNPECFGDFAHAGQSRYGKEAYVRCVYDTLFSNGTTTEAISGEDLLKAWRGAFDNPSRGGCPGV